jgi:hypothetical protein
MDIRQIQTAAQLRTFALSETQQTLLTHELTHVCVILELAGRKAIEQGLFFLLE